MTPHHDLQNFILSVASPTEAPQAIFFRGNGSINGSGELALPAPGVAHFDTELNVISLRKWREVCALSDLGLRVMARGDFDLSISSLNFRDGLVGKTILVQCSSETLRDHDQVLDLSQVCARADVDIIAVSIHTRSTPVLIQSITLVTPTPPRQEVSIAACICTFNRQEALRNNLAILLPILESSQLPVKFIVSNNGGDLGHTYDPRHCDVLQGRNIGGAGGFTRGIVHALRGSYSHVLLMDDDIVCPPESLLRLTRVLQYRSEPYRHAMVSGAMLSLTEPWLQYERNAELGARGFAHRGHKLDLRDPVSVWDNASAMPGPGVAGWWFCAIPIHLIRQHGLPLPVFIRGDDIEFSLRLQAPIISWNGILVWHQPFDTKYSDMMEDYYLVRNMFLISLLYDKPGLYATFVRRKIKGHLRTFNYLGASLNILAAKDVINGRLWEDPKATFDRIAAHIQAHRRQVSPIHGSSAMATSTVPIPWLNRRGWGRAMLSSLQMLTPLIRGEGRALGGFDRDYRHFIGKAKVRVMDRHTGLEEWARFDRLSSLTLKAEFARLNGVYRLNRGELARKLKAAATPFQSLDSWKDILSKDEQAR